MSSGVARLEEELGVKLFDRSSRGVKPTPHGARILPLIEHVLDDLDTLAAEAQRLASPVTETIRMGVSPLIGAELVARAFNAARNLKRPRDLVLREADLDPLRADLEAGRLDIVLVPAVPGMPTVRHHVIARESVVVIDCAAASDSPVELEDAAGARLHPSALHLRTDHLHHRTLPQRRRGAAHVLGRRRRLQGSGRMGSDGPGSGAPASLRGHAPARQLPPPLPGGHTRRDHL
ncbi:LysR family transcriptional regulator [Streptomyces sp. NPDC002133]|uniref:LysR family transcriptional regulator n=1 Tax=Streptomyces sp. NPDC002133 TaxID=3154409 RepID=UPI003323FFDC